MIEAVEVHETRIMKPVDVKLMHPFVVGIWMGMGFIVAPFVLVFGFMILIAIGAVFTS